MLRLRRCFVLLLTAFWLPLQSLTAFIMPLGLLSLPAQAASNAVADAMPCHALTAEPDAMPDRAVDTLPEQTCQQCGVCHLFTAGYMPAALPRNDQPAQAPVMIAADQRPLGTRFTEPPHHPPRS